MGQPNEQLDKIYMTQADMQALIAALQVVTANILNLRTEILAVKALVTWLIDTKQPPISL